MKKILLMSLAASMYLNAATYCFPGEDCLTDSLVISDQSTTNDVIGNNGRMGLSDGNNMALTGGQFVFNGDVKIVNVPAAFNVTDNIGIEAGIPIVNNSKFPTGVFVGNVAQTEDNMGIGDVSVGANYNFGSYSSTYGLNVTTLRYKSSTGDETKGLGIGKDSYTISHAFAKELDFLKLRTNAMLAYTVNDEKVLGNALNTMLAVSRPCLLSDKVRTNIKVNYRTIDETLDATYTFGSAGYTNLDLWLEFNSDKLISDIPIGAGVKFPIIDSVSSNGYTTDGSKTVLFYLSLGAML